MASLAWSMSNLLNPHKSLHSTPQIRSLIRCDNVLESMKWKDNGKPITVALDYNGQATSIPSFSTSHNQLLDRIPAQKNDTRLRIFSGTANPSLSQEIACYMGLELGKIKIKRFADGEIYVQLQESVRGCDVYLVQPTCPPANENLMELLIMIDACRRASAKNITAVIPYFGYARADRKTQGRESIAAKLVANLITEAGADRVLACDLHSGQSIGYFDIPVDHVHGLPVILDYLASKTICSDDLVVVSPDVGGVARARAFAKKLSDAPLAIVDKRRHGHNVAEVMNLIGDVKGKVAVMVDDMIDTAGTIAKGAALLHQEGAREVYACSTHAVFSCCMFSPIYSASAKHSWCIFVTFEFDELLEHFFMQSRTLILPFFLEEMNTFRSNDTHLSTFTSSRSREIVEWTVSRGYHNKHYSSIRTELFSAAYNLICGKPLRGDYMACA